MKKHENIKFFRNPRMWVIDKFNTGMNKPGVYVLAFFPSILIAIGLIADVISIFDIDIKQNNSMFIILLFLFVYGIINLFLIAFLQRYIVRLDRTREYFKKIHNDIILTTREYFIEKNNGSTISRDETIKYLKDILTSFNNSFIKDIHGEKATITLKYINNNKLFPIRVGENIENRENNEEDVKKSYIFNALNNSNNKLRYIYIKDLAKPDIYERTAMGNEIELIQSRALNKYKTFIAVPIRSGVIKKLTTNSVIIKKNLGILGIDFEKKYKFGNFNKYELYIIECLTDSISLIVQDLS